ncbi:protein-L-isoaspartate(D-aspartate) O-methyltransferase [Streptosporangium becharense]|uniref:Protein-L-isoaspartate O-methyltransferase n=1 Tax=Streptosporangium becharense TaxID=1816182 RepID=A0A7W9MJ85_9ACTN|nr:methyltransferase, FxLD system [Streptosporangium becharense]MBB2911854.1 protein-L-isoaspartate(D-aspartate) O-methyltransferase [Streptosporangium becharense]MBB5822328.1 protein-L-isoaspartate(D-aspartate) O-methyltransferase [Streptosporangium becharense]
MAEWHALREELVARVRTRGVSEAVTGALRAVPRHVFLPGLPAESVYRDDAIVTKRDADGLPISSSSQPAIMALMLDQLDVAPGHRVLEIGAGTGYNAGLLAHLVGPRGRVVSIDIDPDLVERAREHLVAAGHPEVTVVCGDGAAGFPAAAPYDRIIATVGVWDLAPAWLEQLAPGGRIVAPLDLRGVQRSVAMERSGGHWTSRSVLPCGFMRMRGPFAGPEVTRMLDRDSDLTISLPEAGEVGDLLRALDGPAVELSTEVGVSHAQLSDGLGLWLAVREPRWCTVWETRPGWLASPPLDRTGFRMAVGIAEGDSLCLLEPSPDGTLIARGHGPDRVRLAGEMVDHVQAWDMADRPMTAGLRIDAHLGAVPDDGLLVIRKRHTTLVLSWRDGT